MAFQVNQTQEGERSTQDSKICEQMNLHS